MQPSTKPFSMIQPRREILGISAILLPFHETGRIDWDGFRQHVSRTRDAGLVPAVNMDTGYVNLLDPPTRREVLKQTRETLGAGAEFVAGAFSADREKPDDTLLGYQREIEAIQEAGATPVIFQSRWLTRGGCAEILSRYELLARGCSKFIGFELGTMFAPFGKIYDLETYAGLLKLHACVGAKHSSLSRQLEWERIELRDRVRPDFRVFTGNDLAIDMVMYGSDYLLGLSTMAPDLFGLRDRMWVAGDSRFFELNDLLQYLGFFAFRNPVPAYKHTAAQILKLRGWIASDAQHPASPSRPASDTAILAEIVERFRRYESSTPEAPSP